MNTRLALVGALSVVLAGSAMGQVSYEEAQARLRAKQQAATQSSSDEVAHLRQIVENLQAQVAALKQENATLRAKLAKAPQPAAPAAATANAVAIGMTKADVQALQKKIGHPMRITTEQAAGDDGKPVTREIWAGDDRLYDPHWPNRIVFENGVVTSVEMRELQPAGPIR